VDKDPVIPVKTGIHLLIPSLRTTNGSEAIQVN